MSQERLKMSKLREILRLKLFCNLTNRQTARAVNVAPSTVGLYYNSIRAAELSWEDVEKLDDISLQQQVESNSQQLSRSNKSKQEIDLSWVHQQLKHKGVTRELLWEEYKKSSEKVPFSYTEFCRRYREYQKKLKPSMRQSHKAGEKIFVDYAGPKVPIVNAKTGEISESVIFVGVFGASNYTYAEATSSRSLPDWIGSHVRMFEFFGGVPKLVIPDNEKSGVNKACYYDPELNPQYAALAYHYQTTILPTRPVKPKDKAKAEAAVLLVERWILARLRHQKFFSLEELNHAISALLLDLNQRPFKKLPGSRKSQFEALDKPELQPLPNCRYQYTDIKKARVRLDYHVEVDNHYYSVPHHLINKQVQYQCGQHAIEIFYQGNRVASHIRSNKKQGSTTIEEHMPEAHRRHRQWSPDIFLTWGKSVGVATTQVIKNMISSQPNPECSYRQHLGLKNLAKRYSNERLESACAYGITHSTINYRNIKSILETKIDQVNEEIIEDNYTPPSHYHVRGANYYLQ